MADSEAPPRVSRYRSQRRAQQQAAEDAPELPRIPQQEDAMAGEGVVRSKSRYHRKPAASTEPAQLGAEDLDRIQSYEQDGQNEQLANGEYLNGRSVRKPEVAPATPPPLVHTLSQPTGELFPPPRMESVRPVARGNGPPASDRIQATKSMTELLINAEDDEESGGCFGLFKRKRGEFAPQAEKRPIARTPSSRDGPRAILAGGGGIVPGTDAPVSAVNAGDRKVLVECGRSKTIFPVTPTTTPVDLIKSAANLFSERIDVRSAVLLEHFDSVGVRRPLRRYEHIRDVMNSWDTDRQNSLLVVDPGTGSSEIELSIAGVPQDKPGEMSWLLSYSQKVGKWDKRIVTLKRDGQITQHKDQSKPQQAESVCHLSDFDIYTPTQEKLRRKIKPPKKSCFAIKSQQKTIMFESTQNYVHFFGTNDRRTADDFYNAVQGWRSWYLVNIMGEGKKAKPVAEPSAVEKEMGGAILQPSMGHRPGESFDSHYQLGSFRPLVNMDQFEDRPSTARSANAPPLSAGGFTKSSSQFDTTASPERRTSTAKRTHHPVTTTSNRTHIAEDEPPANIGRRASVKRTSMDHTRPTRGEFDSNGLLGRQYSQRRREYDERENIREQAFGADSGLINGGDPDDYARRQHLEGPRHNMSTRVKHAHKTTSSSELHRNQSTRNRGSVDLGRSGSTRVKDMPRPLVDLAPQYREPPQHAKISKGKGFFPDQIGPGGLIDNATTPEDPLASPPTTDRRGQNNTSGLHAPDYFNPTRSGSQHGKRPTPARSPHSGDAAFTGEGLLARGQGQQGWGDGAKGRGVIDGSRAKGPMLDLSEPSIFVPGSLLNRVDRERGPEAPIVERKR
ncbi:hypothetical protein LTR08_007298 [Meristemomyces frigidus]|nr:hypothetical protein LTR08_007298 [Meristemomyces frigidus]